MFEYLLTEWHLDPVYIAENWTDEMLGLMIEKRNERVKAINETLSGKTIPHVKPLDNKITDKQLFKQLGKKMKVVKKQ